MSGVNENRLMVPAAPTIPGNRRVLGLELLPFRMPEFTRVAWVSDHARLVWEPRFHKIGQAWLELEHQTVLAGSRPCAAVTVDIQQFPEFAGRLARNGISTLPFEVVSASTAPYTNRISQPIYGKPYQYRVVIGSIENLVAFEVAWRSGDQHAVGALLGYPSCCQEFFRVTWVELGIMDTTWPMAIGTKQKEFNSAEDLIVIPPRVLTNILWKWIGIRSTFHLPCSFDCPHSEAIGQIAVELGCKSGKSIEMEWLTSILSWPIEWTALHGIAELKTPILKISTATDATTRKYTVRVLGSNYPAEGAVGFGFPYRDPTVDAPHAKREEVSLGDVSLGYDEGGETPETVASNTISPASTQQ